MSESDQEADYEIEKSLITEEKVAVADSGFAPLLVLAAAAVIIAYFLWR